jgi:hypothetical protein
VLLGQHGFFDRSTVSMHRSAALVVVEDWQSFDDRFGIAPGEADAHTPRLRPEVAAASLSPGRRDGFADGAKATSARSTRAMDARWNSEESGRDGVPNGPGTTADQGREAGGAKWSRTTDLSIISAAL